MTSPFERVKKFHELFELPIRDSLYSNMFNDQDLINLRMKLIQEEYDELNEAIINKDIIETIDALGDLLFVIIGFGTSCGLKLNDAFDLIYESNMTKLCNTEEEAQQTIQWYKDNRPNFKAAYRKTKDNTKWLVYDSLSGKVLKNINYEKVNLNTLFN